MISVHPADLTPAQASAAAATHGLGLISNAISATVTERLNGDRSLRLQAPATAHNLGLLVADRLICAQGQFYRIQRPRQTDRGGRKTIEAEAAHILYDLEQSTIVNIETREDPEYIDGITASQALAQVLDGSAFAPGTVDLAPSKLDYLEILRMNRLTCLSQIVETWGGEIIPDNWTIHLLAQSGQDRGVRLRLGLELDGLEIEEDISRVKTRLHIVGYQDANIESVNDGKDYLDSPHIGQYSQIREDYAYFEDEDDPQELKRLGLERLAEVDKVQLMVRCEMLRLAKSQQEFYAALRQVSVGDTVTVEHERVGDLAVRVLERELDLLSGDNIRLILGNAQADQFFRGFKATAQTAQTARRRASQASQEAKSAMSTVNTLTVRVEAAESTISQTPEMISAAVNEIQVGGRNLLINSDFQLEPISPWNKNVGSTMAYLYPDHALYNFCGKRSLNLRMPADGEATGYIYQDITKFDIASGANYILSFFYYITGAWKNLFGSGTFASINQLDGDGVAIPGTIVRVRAESITTINNWARCVVPVTLNEGCKTVRVSFYINTTEGQQNQWFINDIQLEKGNKATQWAPSEKDPVSSLANSFFRMLSDLFEVYTGGKARLYAGSLFSIEAGTVQIEAEDASDSFIQFGDVFYIGREGNDYILNINSKKDNAIQVNNNAVWHKGNLAVQQAQPASGKQTVWIKPGTTTNVEYKTTITTTANLNYSFGTPTRNFSLAIQSGDTMNAAGTYYIDLTITFKRYGGTGVDTYDITGGTVVLTKGGTTLSIPLPAMSFGSWRSITVTVQGSTTSTDFTSATGDIGCAITLTGVKPYASSDFISHARPSDIKCVITGPGSLTAQPCQIFFTP